ncbi:hypothetical protein M3B46_10095 [Sphingobacterium daejeonense]|uniref:hypothetical protein n=1 Tax=Sphingobacterium daejeonense TaxID=371142 RepID=UPI0021A795C8|nr:hypothetical protein [Sphingobacterium daejeonense]MCT1531347.1 hypothetical protein [Sphingobacterium daejeonense]
MRCIIIEDEPLATRRLQSLIKEQKLLKLLGDIDDIEEIESFLSDLKKTDVLFLDLRIKGGNIELIQDYITSIPFIVVTSALVQEDYPSFIKQREHFILRKPIRGELFNKCLEIIFTRRRKLNEYN